MSMRRQPSGHKLVGPAGHGDVSGADGSHGEAGLDRGDILARQVRADLLGRIECGEWRPGQRLPTEASLAQLLGVSRTTLREALRGLEEDGFLRRTRGAGTYLTYRPRLRNNLDINFGVSALIRSMGLTPGTQDPRVFQAVGNPDECERLGAPPGTQMVVIERVRTADGTPVVFSRDIVPAYHIDAATIADQLGQGSLYDVLRENGIRVVQGAAIIRPLAANREVSSALGIRRGTLLLYLLQVDYDVEGRPVLLSHEYHLDSAFEMTVHRRGPNS
jgi:GntR family transcriptional regulator